MEYEAEGDVLTVVLKKKGKWVDTVEVKAESGRLEMVLALDKKGELLRLEVLDASRLVPKLIIGELLARGELSKSPAKGALQSLSGVEKKEEEQQTATH
jgi:hypothetical protein